MSRWTRANPLMSVSGYKVPRGHFANGYTNGGDRVGFKSGGRAGFKHGSGTWRKNRAGGAPFVRKRTGNITDKYKLTPSGHYIPTRIKEDPRSSKKRAEGGRIGLKKGSNKNWIQKAVNPKHKGFCTPMTKKTCTPKRKALARTFKKMGRARKGKA